MTVQNGVVSPSHFGATHLLEAAPDRPLELPNVENGRDWLPPPGASRGLIAGRKLPSAPRGAGVARLRWGGGGSIFGQASVFMLARWAASRPY